MDQNKSPFAGSQEQTTHEQTLPKEDKKCGTASDIVQLWNAVNRISLFY